MVSSRSLSSPNTSWPRARTSDRKSKSSHAAYLIMRSPDGFALRTRSMSAEPHKRSIHALPTPDAAGTAHPGTRRRRVVRTGGRTERDQADQRRAEPVQHRQRLLQAARRPDLGIDERGRDRQGRQVDLGRRAVRRQQLPRSRDRQDVGRPDHPQVRCDRQAGQELRRRAARSSRTASTSIATATSG